jgi:hypothetical protein
VTSSPSSRRGLPTYLQVTLGAEERFAGILPGYYVAPPHPTPSWPPICYSPFTSHRRLANRGAGEFLAKPDGTSYTSIEPCDVMTGAIVLQSGILKPRHENR